MIIGIRIAKSMLRFSGQPWDLCNKNSKKKNIIWEERRRKEGFRRMKLSWDAKRLASSAISLLSPRPLVHWSIKPHWSPKISLQWRASFPKMARTVLHDYMAMENLPIIFPLKPFMQRFQLLFSHSPTLSTALLASWQWRVDQKRRAPAPGSVARIGGVSMGWFKAKVTETNGDFSKVILHNDWSMVIFDHKIHGYSINCPLYGLHDQ